MKLINKYIDTHKSKNIFHILALHKELSNARKIKPFSECYSMMLESIIPLLFDTSYNDLNIGLAIDAGKDPFPFERIREKLEETKNFNEKIKILFPTTSTVNKTANQEFFIELIETLFPNEIKQAIIHQTKTIIWKNT